MKVPEMTLCHIFNDFTGATPSILLKKASRGVSKGKWNAVGGKIERGETPEEGAFREAFEESGLAVSRLFYHGKMLFHLDGANFLVHLFSTHTYAGKLTESDEGELAWFKLSEIPYDKMWDDDQFWLTLMLRSVKFDAKVYFNENGIVDEMTIYRRFD